MSDDWRPCPDCGAPQVRTEVTGVYVHVHSLRQACDRPSCQPHKHQFGVTLVPGPGVTCRCGQMTATLVDGQPQIVLTGGSTPETIKPVDGNAPEGSS